MWRWGLVAVVAACNVQNRNHRACEDYVDSIRCGDTDWKSLGLDETYCRSFEEFDCDITDYFDCMIDGAQCRDGQFSPADNCEPPAC